MEGFTRDPTDDRRGICPRAIEDIFAHIQSVKSRNPSGRFLVRGSYLQIYNENVSDLLRPERTNLSIREDRRRGVYVEGLSEWVVRCPREVSRLMERGTPARRTATTTQNDISSRSHAVFVVVVEQSTYVSCVTSSSSAASETEKQEMTTQSGAGDGRCVRVGKLNLVDLAGSERVRVTGATGQRLAESKKINQSLSALGNVISALTERGAVRQHIPYRDSKLTRLLEDSLGGNCLTTLMAMIGPAASGFHESLSTLKFATRAKFVRNAPRVNEDAGDDSKALLRKYEKELLALKQQLSECSRTLVDKRRLLEAERRRREAEDGQREAVEALRRQQAEVDAEKDQRRCLESKMAALASQFLVGGDFQVPLSFAPPGTGGVLGPSGPGGSVSRGGTRPPSPCAYSVGASASASASFVDPMVVACMAGAGGGFSVSGGADSLLAPYSSFLGAELGGMHGNGMSDYGDLMMNTNPTNLLNSKVTTRGGDGSGGAGETEGAHSSCSSSSSSSSSQAQAAMQAEDLQRCKQLLVKQRSLMLGRRERDLEELLDSRTAYALHRMATSGGVGGGGGGCSSRSEGDPEARADLQGEREWSADGGDVRVRGQGSRGVGGRSKERDLPISTSSILPLNPMMQQPPRNDSAEEEMKRAAREAQEFANQAADPSTRPSPVVPALPPSSSLSASLAPQPQEAGDSSSSSPPTAAAAAGVGAPSSSSSHASAAAAVSPSSPQGQCQPELDVSSNFKGVEESTHLHEGPTGAWGDEVRLGGGHREQWGKETADHCAQETEKHEQGADQTGERDRRGMCEEAGGGDKDLGAVDCTQRTVEVKQMKAEDLKRLEVEGRCGISEQNLPREENKCKDVLPEKTENSQIATRTIEEGAVVQRETTTGGTSGVTSTEHTDGVPECPPSAQPSFTQTTEFNPAVASSPLASPLRHGRLWVHPPAPPPLEEPAAACRAPADTAARFRLNSGGTTCTVPEKEPAAAPLTSQQTEKSGEVFSTAVHADSHEPRGTAQETKQPSDPPCNFQAAAVSPDVPPCDHDSSDAANSVRVMRTDGGGSSFVSPHTSNAASKPEVNTAAAAKPEGKTEGSTLPAPYSNAPPMTPGENSAKKSNKPSVSSAVSRLTADTHSRDKAPCSAEDGLQISPLMQQIRLRPSEPRDPPPFSTSLSGDAPNTKEPPSLSDPSSRESFQPTCRNGSPPTVFSSLEAPPAPDPVRLVIHETGQPPKEVPAVPSRKCAPSPPTLTPVLSSSAAAISSQATLLAALCPHPHAPPAAAPPLQKHLAPPRLPSSTPFQLEPPEGWPQAPAPSTPLPPHTNAQQLQSPAEQPKRAVQPRPQSAGCVLTTAPLANQCTPPAPSTGTTPYDHQKPPAAAAAVTVGSHGGPHRVVGTAAATLSGTPSGSLQPPQEFPHHRHESETEIHAALRSLGLTVADVEAEGLDVCAIAESGALRELLVSPTVASAVPPVIPPCTHSSSVRQGSSPDTRGRDHRLGMQKEAMRARLLRLAGSLRAACSRGAQRPSAAADNSTRPRPGESAWGGKGRSSKGCSMGSHEDTAAAAAGSSSVVYGGRRSVDPHTTSPNPVVPARRQPNLHHVRSRSPPPPGEVGPPESTCKLSQRRSQHERQSSGRPSSSAANVGDHARGVSVSSSASSLLPGDRSRPSSHAPRQEGRPRQSPHRSTHQHQQEPFEHPPSGGAGVSERGEREIDGRTHEAGDHVRRRDERIQQQGKRMNQRGHGPLPPTKSNSVSPNGGPKGSGGMHSLIDTHPPLRADSMSEIMTEEVFPPENLPRPSGVPFVEALHTPACLTSDLSFHSSQNGNPDVPPLPDRLRSSTPDISCLFASHTSSMGSHSRSTSALHAQITQTLGGDGDGTGRGRRQRSRLTTSAYDISTIDTRLTAHFDQLLAKVRAAREPRHDHPLSSHSRPGASQQKQPRAPHCQPHHSQTLHPHLQQPVRGATLPHPRSARSPSPSASSVSSAAVVRSVSRNSSGRATAALQLSLQGGPGSATVGGSAGFPPGRGTPVGGGIPSQQQQHILHPHQAQGDSCSHFHAIEEEEHGERGHTQAVPNTIRSVNRKGQHSRTVSVSSSLQQQQKQTGSRSRPNSLSQRSSGRHVTPTQDGPLDASGCERDIFIQAAAAAAATAAPPSSSLPRIPSPSAAARSLRSNSPPMPCPNWRGMGGIAVAGETGGFSGSGLSDHHQGDGYGFGGRGEGPLSGGLQAQMDRFERVGGAAGGRERVGGAGGGLLQRLNEQERQQGDVMQNLPLGVDQSPSSHPAYSPSPSSSAGSKKKNGGGVSGTSLTHNSAEFRRSGPPVDDFSFASHHPSAKGAVLRDISRPGGGGLEGDDWKVWGYGNNRERGRESGMERGGIQGGPSGFEWEAPERSGVKRASVPKKYAERESFEARAAAEALVARRKMQLMKKQKSTNPANVS
uniref:Kinesin motor domain-containing protein n=1 Tax=Chromera velia CCMP2878 TaxID=1169474 RepID=A0A0G4H586_9ALVE|eukprot:Cvel_5709.t1-p1 / transcript=Cvel_5709.t1 / gene=Cvel_5709 / organism=Chromera_velia_CCMP2878 / gene_product=Kinesin-II 95 kDa subunit, putative / transcript_product=Kinesin-II 95 kDa subunit, putative / location=Cvel_scaffold270:37711-51899(-) / protein_length=2428 / sequence_SO=supercontig / SO=protein_coding / is_pseudo=false